MNTTLSNLRQFIDDYNNDNLKYQPHPIEVVKRYTHSLCESLLPEKDEPFRLRLSQIGKPPIIQGLKVIGYGELPLGHGRLRNTVFHAGREFESRFKYLIEVYGPTYDLRITAEEVDTEYDGVKGHGDIVLNDELLLELKTMGAGSFREASRKGISDDLGYFTQLATYQYSTGLEGVWVVEDKASSRIKLIDGPTPTQQREKLDRASAIIAGLRHLEAYFENSSEGLDDTVYELLVTFDAPSPREWRGKQYLPWSMTWTPFREALYVYEQEEGKSPVFIDYMDPEETVEILNELVEEGLITYGQEQEELNTQGTEVKVD